MLLCAYRPVQDRHDRERGKDKRNARCRRAHHRRPAMTASPKLPKALQRWGHSIQVTIQLAVDRLIPFMSKLTSIVSIIVA